MSEAIGAKQFLVIVVLWFAFTYVLMWLLSGACTGVFGFSGNVSVEQACPAADSVSGLANVPVLGLFLPFNPWVSVMYFFAPIAGFVLAFFVMRWFNEFFETDQATSVLFPVLLILVLIAGYAINLYWYTNESAALNTSSQVKVGLYFCFAETTSQACGETVSRINSELISQAETANSTVVQQYIQVPFWPMLKQSIFLTFIAGAIAAWVPLFALRRYGKMKGKH